MPTIALAQDEYVGFLIKEARKGRITARDVRDRAKREDITLTSGQNRSLIDVEATEFVKANL
jgi:hypothetical protein